MRTSRYKNLLVNLSLTAGFVILFAVLLEGGARVFWTAERGDLCRVEDEKLMYKPRPNCERRIKEPEGDLITYRFNACGFRGNGPCVRRPPDTLRVFGIGDSFTLGLMVSEPDTYLQVAQKWWNEHLPYPVEVYNAGEIGYDLFQYSLRLDQAFEHDAQLIMIGLLPNDLFTDNSETGTAERQALVRRLGVQGAHKAINRERKWVLFERAQNVISQSRFGSLLTHLLFSIDAVYLRAYLMRYGEQSYMRVPYSDVWTAKMRDADRLIADMTRRARARGVELVIIVIPQRVQAILVKRGGAVSGVDPFAFGDAIRSIGARYGIVVVDFLKALERNPDPARLFYPVDGHLTPEGQRLLGLFVARALVNERVIPHKGR